ncbi:YAP1-binding protein 1 [Wickerhamomyces ciferrii]|uniref:YAP1-binding protein 1 n=1 Tax=Wickerhamomyces ciferrii (strain ATCC 14091 / BCRC 22168 / CBS 111 / JCM 3599 / NBRC 0793 / NRRL Y-1031 F-60-10) TaxID=1206466 RepID=K0KI01_WICCF|nr:YAP1-binding protein 1 [Wickerhamomyces ciferrii]CCH42651.1 YAP1-binding protein 1 [Wickerhamomyces ciferrii]
MSDTETNSSTTEVEHLDQPPSVTTIIEYFESALIELESTKDYISYATLLDFYLSDPSIYNDDDKILILKKLYDIFSNDIILLQEIGWDLPELFLNFYNSNEFDYQGSLLDDTELIKIIMKNFELLAKFGNPKEIFLKTTELISSFALNDDPTADEKTSRILDVKLHTLVELMSTSLKRINTIYPSRFLSMAITSLLNMAITYFDKFLNYRFVIRRLYSFARDYIPPLKPTNFMELHKINEQEAFKIESDENYLQRQLLKSYLTQISELSFKNVALDLSCELFKSLQLKNSGILPPTNETDEELFTSSRGLFSRVTQLALSFDIDLELEFDQLKKSSIEMFSKIDSKLSNDDKIQELLKISLNDKISYLFNPKMEKIPMNQGGLLLFITQYTKEISKLLPIKIYESIPITIRLISPGLISSNFQRLGNLDSIIFWNWVSIVKSTPEDFIKIPNYQLILFLQILIYFASTLDSKPTLRIVIFTLLTRVLTMIDECIRYDFLIDTLTMSPYPNSKIAMIPILKDLILRVKPLDLENKVQKDELDSLSSDLSKTNLNEGKQPPPLPKRQLHYIELNQSRIDDIYTLIRESIDENFISSESSKTIELNESNFKILLSYLNLLIGINSKFPKDKIKEIIEIVEKKLSLLDDDLKIQDPSVNIDFLKLAIDSLKK